jgi:hypothetical protein
MQDTCVVARESLHCHKCVESFFTLGLSGVYNVR